MKLKRSASATNVNGGKKRKVEQLKNGKKPVKAKGKERAFERSTIPIPDADDEKEEEEVEEEDLAFFAENNGRPRPPSPKRTAERLPIKLGDGRIQSTGARAVASESESEDEEEELDQDEEPVSRAVEDVATGARFGRPAVRDVVQQKSRKARIEAAKEQLASICQEIMAEPENSLGLLRRLHTFALPQIPGAISQDGTQLPPTPNDPQIRSLALLSQLAVFKDIVPGYRIRALTEHEKAEKVSQIVQRTRDWEQGLVGVYQNYLKLLEAEVKGESVFLLSSEDGPY
ncbi:hypothetical protein FRC07_005521 [Ceratobasidium sp. 392]|nr:hypothetical protein FRC07_005521 [Ceratobasidium sp. 392]